MNKKLRKDQVKRRPKDKGALADRMLGGPYPGPGHAGRRSVGWALAATGAPR